MYLELNDFDGLKPPDILQRVQSAFRLIKIYFKMRWSLGRCKLFLPVIGLSLIKQPLTKWKIFL